MVYSIISILCIFVLLGTFISIIVRMFSLDRADRIAYIRDYKKGKVVIVYLVFIPIFMMAELYAGIDFFKGLFESVDHSLGLIAFKLDTGNTMQLCADNSVYKFAVYFGYAYVVFNGIMFLISLFSEIFWTFYFKQKFLLSKKSKCIIVGDNRESRIIYKSCPLKNKLIVDKLTKDRKYDLYSNNLHFADIGSYEELVPHLIAEARRLAKYNKKHNLTTYDNARRLNIIVNLDDFDKNIDVCSNIVRSVKGLDEYELAPLNIYVYSDENNNDVFTKLEENSRGVLHQTNKYLLSAIDFVDKYPLTRYMDENMIDYDTSLLKDDAVVKTLLIGFGKRNRQILLSMIANNQFLEMRKGKIEVKPIIFHIFDKSKSDANKRFNHDYYRYKHNFIKERDEDDESITDEMLINEDVEFKVNKDDYLELPKMSSIERYHNLDINDAKFYDDIKKLLGTKKNDINYIVISLGEAIDNIDLTNRLNTKLKEWGYGNTHIFASIENHSIAVNKEMLLPAYNVHTIGDEELTEYNYDNIVGDRFMRMAKQRDYTYNVEYNVVFNNMHDITKEEVEAETIRSLKNWYTKRTHMERQSNLYAVLSIRQKLNLMGLDYVKKEEKGKALTRDEYLTRYAGEDDKPIDDMYIDSMKKQLIRYTLDFKESRRKTMAIHEHSRWNAYMLTQGFIPASKEQIESERRLDGNFTNGKNYTLRRHGNLTTFEGLEEFRSMLDTRDASEMKKTVDRGEKVEDTYKDIKDGENLKAIRNDVIRYDYQLMDDAYWLLDKNGYKIIERKPTINGVIFDMDGVIFDSESVWKRAFERCNEKYSANLDEDYRCSTCGKSEEQIREELHALRSDLDVDAFRDEMIAIVNDDIKSGKFDVKDGFLDVISYLKSKGYKIGLATSSKRDRAESMFRAKKIDMNGIFDACTFSEDVGKRSKPDPYIFKITADKIGIEPKYCMVLEDSINGIQAAYDGGMKAVHVRDLIPPDKYCEEHTMRLIDNLRELKDII